MFGESLTFLWIFISIIGILLFLGIIFILGCPNYPRCKYTKKLGE